MSGIPRSRPYRAAGGASLTTSGGYLKMTIRSRIILLVALTFVALSLIGGYSVIQSRSNAKEVRGVTEGVVTSALASAHLVSLLKEVQLTTMALVSAPDTTIAAQARAALV